MKSVFSCFSKKITQQAPTRLDMRCLLDAWLLHFVQRPAQLQILVQPAHCINCSDVGLRLV